MALLLQEICRAEGDLTLTLNEGTNFFGFSCFGGKAKTL